jgi:putative ABC transport system permease protein
MKGIALGLALGTLVSLAILTLLRGTLHGVSATDPVPVAAVVLVLGATGYAACALPTRRAAKGDPLAVLRQ